MYSTATMRPIALLAAAVLLIAGCTGTSSTATPSLAATATPSEASAQNPFGSRFTESNPVRVGTAPLNVVMEIRDPNDPTKIIGFDVDMLDAIMARADVPYQWVDLEFKGLIPAVEGKRVDLILSSMWVNPDRAKKVNFVTYLRGGMVGVVPAGNPKNVKSLDDYCGLTSVAQLGGLETDILRAQSTKCEAAGKPAIEILTFETQDEQMRNLTNGRADVAMLDVNVFPELAEGAFKGKIEKTFAVPLEFKNGLGVPKGDDQMLEFIYEGIKWYQESGLYDQAIAKFDIDPSLKYPAEKVTE